jgi:hypothetical protein
LALAVPLFRLRFTSARRARFPSRVGGGSFFVGIIAMFAIYNATLVAVMQVGVIVAGVLASGLWHKFATSSGMAMPNPAGLLYSYGMVGFIIPLAWLTVAILIRRSRIISDDLKSLTFWFGVLVLISLTVFMIYADVSPCFRIMWGMSGGDDA